MIFLKQVSLYVAFLLLLIFAVQSLGSILPEEACELIEDSADIDVVRNLHRTGFHRDLETIVYIRDVEDLEQCRLLLIETIPSGIYLDMDEISQLQKARHIEVYSKDKIDVEAPEHLSKEHTVYVYANFNSSAPAELVARVLLPIHGRYQQASKGEFIEVPIKNPRLLIICAEFGPAGCKEHVQKAPCNSVSKGNCNWLPILYRTARRNLSMKLPVAQVQHTWPVTMVTGIVTIVGCTFLAVFVIAKKTRRKKQ